MIVAGWGAGRGHASEDWPTPPGLWPGRFRGPFSCEPVTLMQLKEPPPACPPPPQRFWEHPALDNRCGSRC